MSVLQRVPGAQLGPYDRFPFGQWEGTTVMSVYDNAPEYCGWWHRNVQPLDLPRDMLTRADDAYEEEQDERELDVLLNSHTWYED